mmetsp:Transcript_16460/g.14370  ORF Transcript_16460/g.14370 Transcript_16460/m.14370 type:complete len:112 (-) Transcript_16460:63-398(-)
MVVSKKRIGIQNLPKKLGFKSFDQRRALTKIDNRESSLEEPKSYLYSNPLRSSSVCHKKSLSNERQTSAVKTKGRGGKPASYRHKKIKQRSQMSAIKRVSATQAMINLIKT